MRWLIALTLLPMAACSTGAGAEPEDGGDLASVSCHDDARVRSTDGGSQVGTSGQLAFRLVDSSPNPPSKGDNTLRFEVTQLKGGSAATFALQPNLRMPDHGHTTLVNPKATFDDTAGTYMLAPVDLFMPGVWRLDLTAYDGQVDGGAAIDSTAFFFCVEG